MTEFKLQRYKLASVRFEALCRNIFEEVGKLKGNGLQIQAKGEDTERTIILLVKCPFFRLLSTSKSLYVHHLISQLAVHTVTF